MTKRHEHRFREINKPLRVQCETCGVKGTLVRGWRVVIDAPPREAPAYLKKGSSETLTPAEFSQLVRDVSRALL